MASQTEFYSMYYYKFLDELSLMTFQFLCNTVKIAKHFFNSISPQEFNDFVSLQTPPTLQEIQTISKG